jgi:hypothetical protein
MRGKETTERWHRQPLKLNDGISIASGPIAHKVNLPPVSTDSAMSRSITCELLLSLLEFLFAPTSYQAIRMVLAAFMSTRLTIYTMQAQIIFDSNTVSAMQNC